MKILITDDSAFMRTVVKNALKDFDAEVVEAENGDVAVEIYRETQPDLVLLDIIMPVKNGIMAFQEIRQINPLAKVIFVTSVGQEDMVAKAKELGATEFVAKPFKPEDLQEVVKKHLG